MAVDIRSAYLIEKITSIQKQMKEMEKKVNSREITQEYYTTLKKDAQTIIDNLKEQLN
jgi:hypothetical protein